MFLRKATKNRPNKSASKVYPESVREPRSTIGQYLHRSQDTPIILEKLRQNDSPPARVAYAPMALRTEREVGAYELQTENPRR